MAVLIVGGSGREAGKTAVACALMAALTELMWTAVKVSPHLHEEVRGWEEMNPHAQKDTGRYLAAGARRAFLVRTGEGLDWREFAGSGALLVETNRRPNEFAGLDCVDGPMVFIAVLSGTEPGWKRTMRDRVAEADALVLTRGTAEQDLPEKLRGKPAFVLGEGEWLTPELLGFVRERLASTLPLDVW